MGNLTTKGYRFQKMIAISANSEYEIYPNIPFAWQLKGSIDNTTRRIEKEMDVRFYTYSPVYDYEFVNVQNLMPLLAPRLNYTYKIDNAVIR
jgi:hypothetical protein